MKFLTAKTFKTIFKPNEHLVGLDIGSIYIGVSVSNLENSKQAIPLRTLERRHFLKKFPKLIQSVSPVQLMVVGVPSCNVSNTRKIIEFITRDFKILNLDHIPVVLQNERNTTKESLLYQQANPQDKSFDVDSHSAKLILERFLKKL